MEPEPSTCSDGHAIGYRHEALFYEGAEEFMRGTLPFVQAAVQAGEPTLVVLSAEKIDALREALGAEADAVHFADMAEVGTNPARIIPAWTSFVANHSRPGTRLRGIGEPIWPGRTEAELAECQRHEALLNVCFADPYFWLLCPYDTSALSEAVIAEACRSHPYLSYLDRAEPSRVYPGPDALAAPFEAPLPKPPLDALSIQVWPSSLHDVRVLVQAEAEKAGLSRSRVADFVLAADELAANSIRHGGGRGLVRIWREHGALVCEVRDAGRIEDPLAGRVAPDLEANHGRGLWIANQLCELVQIRTLPTGSVVRIHMRLG